ncbi:hypothetical protein J437_LFUL008294 [Ladona fulva]|uniref:BZIP domain-containing protein n=1 Tax=Ladona fulva TaxID=123851 RepID=A0A8K0KA12_LADFU|nr:hypothetical protein J437_LFUL008294 [Ladona fulva]
MRQQDIRTRFFLRSYFGENGVLMEQSAHFSVPSLVHKMEAEMANFYPAQRWHIDPLEDNFADIGPPIISKISSTSPQENTSAHRLPDHQKSHSQPPKEGTSPTEISPSGREEVEMEKAFISEAWLSNPMLEEDDMSSLETVKPTSVNEDTTSPEKEAKLEFDPNGIDVILFEDLEMHDMELGLHQPVIYQQSLNKNYNQPNEWDGTGDNTQSLLREFESICDVYNGALTPPCSPTPSPTPPQSNHTIAQAPCSTYIPPPCETIDLDRELAMVDEILRDRAEALENASPRNDLIIPDKTSPPNVVEPVLLMIPEPTQSISPVNISKVEEVLNIIPKIKVEQVSTSLSPGRLQEVPAASPVSSYCFSPNSVASSLPESSRPDSPSSLSSEETSDSEWVPSRVAPKRQRVKPYSRSLVCSSSDTSEFSPQPSTSRGRRAPRRQLGVDDRKERKKEQNKNAATRYRMKKKAEAKEVESEERQLEDKNEMLCVKAAELAREVSYLKKLMRQMFKARGILSEN